MDRVAIKTSLRISIIYLTVAGTGLLLHSLSHMFLNTPDDISYTHYIQDCTFLLFTAIILFVLIFQFSKKHNQLKKQALHNELRYRSLFDNMREGACVYRPINQGQDFVVIDINEKGQKINQTNRQQIIGQKLSSLPHDDKNSKILDVIKRVYKSGKPEQYHSFQYQDQQLQKWRNFYIFCLDTQEVVAVYDDITDKKRLEEQLKRSEQYHTLQNSIITRFLTNSDDSIYQEILKVLATNLHCSYALLGITTHTNTLSCTSISNTANSFDTVTSRAIVTMEDLPDHTVQTVINKGETLLGNSQSLSPEKHQNLSNSILLPVQQQNKTIALLCLGNKDTPFTPNDTTLLENICCYIAPILQTQLHTQDLKKRHFAANTELIKSEASLKKAEKIAGLGHWEHDIINDTLTWSEEVYRICSLDPKTFRPSIKNLFSLIHPDDREMVNQAYSQAVEKKQNYNITHRFILKNGDIKHVQERCVFTYDNDGTAIRSLGTALDISGQIEAKEEYKRLATAIEHTVDVIVITDAMGIIQYVNPAFEHITGYAKQEAIGQNPRILQSGHHSPAFYRNLWNTITNGNVWHGNFTNKTKTGKCFTEETSITPIKDKDGKIISFVAVKHDISRELEMEQQLRQAAKMESIGTLAGGIAHDFNNILGAILGYTRMAMNELSEKSQAYQDLTHAIQSGDRAVELIRQILLFSRHQEQGFIPIQIQVPVAESLKMLRASLSASIVVEANICSDCPAVMASPSQIHQIVMNLCTNAKQAMLAEGGTLSVTLSTVEKSDTNASHPDIMPGRYVQLVVNDTGSGIKEKHLSQIFDPFFTTKGLQEGTGLGLAVTHGIVKSHNGFINVESLLNRGTTFTILLPVAGIEDTMRPQQDKTAPLDGTEHILIVDDEHNIRSLHKRMLLKAGYQVTSFSCSVEALSSFQDSPYLYDLVLTDMNMPIMNGLELTKRLLSVRPNLPIILCTGDTTLISKQQSRDHGIRSLLYKPTSPIVVEKTIRNILD